MLYKSEFVFVLLIIYLLVVLRQKEIFVVCEQNGHVQIFDLASSALLENVEAHTDSVTSMSMASDKVESFHLVTSCVDC